MKRFQFPFERVMEWRDRHAELQRAELQRLHGVRSELAESRTQIGVSIHDASTPPGEGGLTSGCDLQHLASYVQALRTQEQTLHAAQQECQTAIGSQTSACVEADRDYELLARLRDRKLATWKGEFHRESEQAAADNWMAGRSRAEAILRRNS